MTNTSDSSIIVAKRDRITHVGNSGSAGIGEGEEDGETVGVAVATDAIFSASDDVVGAGVGEGFAVRVGV